jgi:hypothetical protein
MGPFHVPWSTFGSVLLVAAAIILALGWAAWDKRRGDREDGA